MHTMYRNGYYHPKSLWALWEHWSIYFYVSWSCEPMRLDSQKHAGGTRVPHNFLDSICHFGPQNPLFEVTIEVFCRLKTSVFHPTYFHGMMNSASNPDPTNSEQHWTDWYPKAVQIHIWGILQVLSLPGLTCFVSSGKSFNLGTRNFLKSQLWCLQLSWVPKMIIFHRFSMVLLMFGKVLRIDKLFK